MSELSAEDEAFIRGGPLPRSLANNPALRAAVFGVLAARSPAGTEPVPVRDQIAAVIAERRWGSATLVKGADRAIADALIASFEIVPRVAGTDRQAPHQNPEA